MSGNMIILFISGQEIFIVLLVVLLLFGAKKIPDIARGLGKGIHEFRKAASEIKDEMNIIKEQPKPSKSVEDSKQEKSE